MREKYSCERESVRLHLNAWDLRALHFPNKEQIYSVISKDQSTLWYKKTQDFLKQHILLSNSTT